jgi:phage-related protein
MRGIQFDEYHTADDWGLILSAKEIKPPQAKIIKISVDGRDGDLDLSETLTGDISYSDRNASFSFLATEGTHAEREDLMSTIVNYLHGRTRQIIDPDDPEHYLVGRCEVSSLANDRAMGTISVEATCEPYRYALEEVNRTISLKTTPSDYVLTNVGRKTLTPSINVTGSANLKFDNTSVSLATGRYSLPGLRLKNGATVVTLSGSGTITFSYREAII